MISVAFSTLVIEPMCITVSGVTPTLVVTLVTPAAATSHWPARNTAALAPGTLCFLIDDPRRLARSPAVERPDTAGNACPSAAAGSSKRETAATPPTAPKLRKRSRLFIVISPRVMLLRVAGNRRRVSHAVTREWVG